MRWLTKVRVHGPGYSGIQLPAFPSGQSKIEVSIFPFLPRTSEAARKKTYLSLHNLWIDFNSNSKASTFKSYTGSRIDAEVRTQPDSQALTLIWFPTGPVSRKRIKSYIQEMKKMMRGWDDQPDEEYREINPFINFTKFDRNFGIGTLKTILNLEEDPTEMA